MGSAISPLDFKGERSPQPRLNLLGLQEMQVLPLPFCAQMLSLVYPVSC